MSQEEQIFQIASKPGIRRDGTQLDTNFFSDGRWVRFYRGRPRKMGGWKRGNNQMSGPSRALYVYGQGSQNAVYNFHTGGVEVLTIDNTGNGAAPVSRTPVGFVANDNFLWQHDALFDITGGGNAKIIAHAGQTALNIDDRTNYPVWFGNLSDSAALTEATTAPTRVSGGCVVLQPYLFIYGNDGLIRNSDRNNPTNFTTGGASEANAVNVAGTKIVKGLPLRGGSNSPAGLFWALDAMIRVSFVGGTKIFSYDTVSGQTSILAQNSPIEYDGIYYWIGVDRFLMYGGVIREVPNQLNLDWFFENLNWDHRNKIFATKMPRHGEIWWLFPKGTSTECNHAIIFNVREQTWYDTPLNRTSAYYSQALRYPVMVGSAKTGTGSNTYPFYVHEFGRDAIEGDDLYAIESFFETADFGLAAGGPLEDKLTGVNQWLALTRVEPDFDQIGDMSLTVLGREYANSPDSQFGPYVFTGDTERVDIRKQLRHVRLRFTSNVLGGDYIMGKPLITAAPGEVRE